MRKLGVVWEDFPLPEEEGVVFLAGQRCPAPDLFVGAFLNCALRLWFLDTEGSEGGFHHFGFVI